MKSLVVARLQSVDETLILSNTDFGKRNPLAKNGLELIVRSSLVTAVAPCRLVCIPAAFPPFAPALRPLAP
jgi:hypothetical protein